MREQNKRWWLYILKLERGKWYVGITSKHPEERFQEHKLGKRAAYWTMEHKPLEIELIEDLGIVSKEHAEKYEAKVTRNLMKERGLNNVRGGDLRDIKEYVSLAGYIYDKESIKNIALASVIYILLLAFYVDKYIFRFIPGGI